MGISDGPKDKTIIYEPSVEEQVILEGIKEGVLEEGIEDSSIGWSRGGTHGSSTELFPMCVTKGEDILGHDQSKGLHEGLHRKFITEVPVEVGLDPIQGLGSGDVGVHGHGISSDKVGVGGQFKLGKLLLELKGALEVRPLVFGNCLEFAINPDTKGPEEASTLFESHLLRQHAPTSSTPHPLLFI